MNNNKTATESQLNPDESKSLLGIATRMDEQLMPKVSPEEMGEEMQMPQEPMQEEPEEMENTEKEMPDHDKKMSEMEGKMEDMEKKLDMEEYMADMETRMDEKLESFKNEILEAIK